MQRFILILLLSSVLCYDLQAQTDNFCGKSWSEWRTAWNFSYGRVLFRLEFPSRSCGCGYSFVQMQHDLPSRAIVKIRLEGNGCDGKRFSESFGAEIAGGTISDGRGAFHFFKSMPSVTEVEVSFEEGKNKIKIVGNNIGTTKYINGMTESEYNQQQQKAASANSNSTDNTAKQANSGSTPKAGSTPPTTQQNNSSSAESGATRTNNGSTTQTKTPPPDPAAAQRNVYKNTALDDLQRSQQSTQSPIVQQMHLSNAMITAQASGDAATIRKVQQLQAQATARNQQQLNESVSGLVGSTANLIATIQANKQKKEEAREQRMKEYDERKDNEAVKIAEAELEMAPYKQRALEQLQQGMAEASDAYGAATTDGERLINALSWLWKWRESEKILNTKPQATTLANNKIIVTGDYVTVSAQSLLSASKINDLLGMADLKKIGVVAANAPELIYPTELPSKADSRKYYGDEKNYKNTLDFTYADRSDVSPEEYIDRRYLSLKFTRSYDLSTTFEKSRLSLQNVGTILNYLSIYFYRAIDNYALDSITCVRDGQKKIRYWKGKSWHSIYGAGYSPQKKIESLLIYGGLWLDSAIVSGRPEALSRAAAIYQKSFDWYFNGPASWLKLETQPALLIRQAMWRYGLAVAAARKNLPSLSSDEDPHATLTKAFIKHFEQYCQLPVSQVTQPLYFLNGIVTKSAD